MGTGPIDHSGEVGGKHAQPITGWVITASTCVCVCVKGEGTSPSGLFWSEYQAVITVLPLQACNVYVIKLLGESIYCLVVYSLKCHGHHPQVVPNYTSLPFNENEFIKFVKPSKDESPLSQRLN